MSSGDWKSPRIESIAALESTPRRVELRRLAGVVRGIIEHLSSTTATVEELASAADDLEAIAEILARLPSGQAYEGFAEAASDSEKDQRLANK